MPDITLKDYYMIAVSILSGGGAGVATAFFLGKKLLNHRLNKDIEKFKIDLASEAALIQKKNIELFKKEFTTFNEIINFIINIVEIHGNFNPTDQDRVLKLERAIDDLEDCMSLNRAFIKDLVYAKLIDFIKSTCPDSFTKFTHNDINETGNIIINLYKKHIYK